MSRQTKGKKELLTMVVRGSKVKICMEIKKKERDSAERENETDCPSEDSGAFRTAETCTSTLLILLQG